MRIGFIGLGRMGSGMAHNLRRNGFDLVVYDASPGATAALVEVGATAASSVADVAAADVIFTSLPGPAQVEDVVYGPDGLLAHLRPGQVHFDLSTNALDTIRRVQADYEERGAHFLDAPVSGGPAGAASGELALWVGGDKAVYDQHLAVLQAIGNAPNYVGPIGAGTVTKLAHNTLGYMIMASMAETFSLAVKAGIDPLDLWEGLRAGLVGKGSPLNMLTKQFLPGTYEPVMFAQHLARKDVNLTLSLAKELQVPMRIASLVSEEMTEAMSKGMADGDSRSYLKLQLERAGVEIAVDPERLSQALESAQD